MLGKVMMLRVMIGALTSLALISLAGCNSMTQVKEVNMFGSSIGLAAFPQAQDGMKRFVVELPEKSRAEEKAYAVEIEVGKILETDGVNRVVGAAVIETKDLTGWGYKYYQVPAESLKHIATTKMAVLASNGNINKREYVSLGSKMLGYNSRLPIVVYVPEDAQIRYRVWAAPEVFEDASQK